jgi:hypothetical protein
VPPTLRGALCAGDHQSRSGIGPTIHEQGRRGPMKTAIPGARAAAPRCGNAESYPRKASAWRVRGVSVKSSEPRRGDPESMDPDGLSPGVRRSTLQREYRELGLLAGCDWRDSFPSGCPSEVNGSVASRRRDTRPGRPLPAAASANNCHLMASGPGPAWGSGGCVLAATKKCGCAVS